MAAGKGKHDKKIAFNKIKVISGKQLSHEKRNINGYISLQR